MESGETKNNQRTENALVVLKRSFRLESSRLTENVIDILSERNKGVTRSFGKNRDHGVTPDKVATGAPDVI
jgi:hypothetical protein